MGEDIPWSEKGRHGDDKMMRKAMGKEVWEESRGLASPLR